MLLPAFIGTVIIGIAIAAGMLKRAKAQSFMAGVSARRTAASSITGMARSALMLGKCRLLSDY